MWQGIFLRVCCYFGCYYFLIAVVQKRLCHSLFMLCVMFVSETHHEGCRYCSQYIQRCVNFYADIVKVSDKRPYFQLEVVHEEHLIIAIAGKDFISVLIMCTDGVTTLILILLSKWSAYAVTHVLILLFCLIFIYVLHWCCVQILLVVFLQM